MLSSLPYKVTVRQLTRLGGRALGTAQILAPNFLFKHGRQQSRNSRTDRLAWAASCPADMTHQKPRPWGYIAEVVRLRGSLWKRYPGNVRSPGSTIISSGLRQLSPKPFPGYTFLHIGVLGSR